MVFKHFNSTLVLMFSKHVLFSFLFISAQDNIQFHDLSHFSQKTIFRAIGHRVHVRFVQELVLTQQWFQLPKGEAYMVCFHYHVLLACTYNILNFWEFDNENTCLEHHKIVYKPKCFVNMFFKYFNSKLILRFHKHVLFSFLFISAENII